MRDNRRTQLRRAWQRVRGGQLTPARAFWSVAVGLFVGVQPAPGLHLAVVLAVCVPLHLDAALSYVATNVSIPPVAPLLWLASIQIGERILTGHFAPLTVGGVIELVRAPGMLLGALVLGLCAAAVGYFLAQFAWRARVGLLWRRRRLRMGLQRTAFR